MEAFGVRPEAILIPVFTYGHDILEEFKKVWWQPSSMHVLFNVGGAQDLVADRHLDDVVRAEGQNFSKDLELPGNCIFFIVGLYVDIVVLFINQFFHSIVVAFSTKFGITKLNHSKNGRDKGDWWLLEPIH